MTAEPLSIGENYSYPNIDTYRAGGRYGGATLVKGRIFAIGTRTIETSDGSKTYTREVETKYWKRFQFNPAEVSMAMNAVATDPYTLEQGGGNLPQGVSMGSMTMNIDLLFIREDEVFRAENGLPGARMNNDQLAVYGRVGVQKDVYDIYRILAASETRRVGAPTDDGTATTVGDTGLYNGDALPADPTMASLTGKAFDLAATGSWILYRAVAIQLGETNVYYGWVTSLNVTYNKFNYKLVPTWAKVTMGLDVMAARPASYAPANPATATAGSASAQPSADPRPAVGPGEVALT